MIIYKKDKDADWTTVTLSRAGKVGGIHQNEWNIRTQNDDLTNMNLEEGIHSFIPPL